jgi:hypothetical protein
MPTKTADWSSRIIEVCAPCPNAGRISTNWWQVWDATWAKNGNVARAAFFLLRGQEVARLPLMPLFLLAFGTADARETSD